MPVLLVFDTSAERLAAGVMTPAGRWVREAAGGTQASAALVPTLHGLLEDAGLAFGDLDAIGFGQGPGAFTGLRTACSVAQGLAMALERLVLPLDTLEAVALDAWRRAGDTAARRVWVAQDARMDEIYAAAYRIDAAGRSQAVQPPRLWSCAALNEAWAADPEPTSHADPSTEAPTIVAGSALAAFGERLATGSWRREPEAWPSGQALLDLALQRHAEGAMVPAEQARPAYVRDKVALTTAEREAGRRAAAEGRATAFASR
jgi:tRNA threonylcarbamoyladenosine biosynthesis protein TsaB